VIGGVRIGHHTDRTARTGCTVIVPPPGSVASAEVRGLAPGTRELDLLAPAATIQRCDAIVLAGGSALGLAAASGVAEALRERGIGFPTPGGPVPIVPAAVIFDLAVGAPVAPSAADGRAALAAAVEGRPEVGPVGAGTGATVGKLDGAAGAMPAGLGVAERSLPGGVTVAVIAVANALGDVLAADGRQLAGLRRDGLPASSAEAILAGTAPPPPVGQATTLVVLLTDAGVDKVGCHRLARAAHAGVAQATSPAATAFDGDTAFAIATGTRRAPSALALETAAAAVTADAIRAAVAGAA
jgi:L-aminopeptidase/D-esterase-like protein